MIRVRREQPDDAPTVNELNRQAFLEAFQSSGEAKLVAQLRTACPTALSLVATLDEQIVGHILFTPVTIHSVPPQPVGMGLGPMCVSTEYQRRGIGSQLVVAGLNQLQAANVDFVVVLGHPEYYPRFGFVPATQYGLRSEFADIPAESFMIRVFQASALREISGVVRYRPEFAALAEPD